MARAVLVTRPEPGLARTLRDVAALGFHPVAAPLLQVRALRPPIPATVQAILLTSIQAAIPLSAIAPGLRATPLLAVGDATARVARAAGFERVASAAGDAARLAALATASLDPAAGPLLLACGSGHGQELARGLRRAGFAVLRRCVYAARPVPALPGAALGAIEAGNLEAALFFSAETAAAFLRLLPGRLRPALAGVRALAISEAAALPARGTAWLRVEAAAEPTAASLLSLLG